LKVTKRHLNYRYSIGHISFTISGSLGTCLSFTVSDILSVISPKIKEVMLP